MSSNNKHKKLELKIKNWLEELNYNVYIEYNITDRFYVDFYAEKDDDILLFEIKSSNYNLSQYDFMQLQAYEDYLKTNYRYENKNFYKCFVSGGTISPNSKYLMDEFNINVISHRNETELKNKIKECLSH